MEYNTSDKLAIALACLAGVMAIILFLVEKTPLTVILLLSLMVALAIYPILHFVKRIGVRVAAFSLFVIGTVLLGWFVIPHGHSISAATIQEPQQTKPEEKKADKKEQDSKKPEPKPKPKVDKPNPEIKTGSIEQGPCSNLQIGGSNNQATTNCVSNERRTVDKKTHDDLLAKLSANPDTSMRVIFGALNGDGEATQYALDLYDVFKEAGWTVDGPSPFITDPFHGILITCQSANLPAVKQAFASFKTSGIPVEINEAKSITDKHMTIIVGLPVKR